MDSIDNLLIIVQDWDTINSMDSAQTRTKLLMFKVRVLLLLVIVGTVLAGLTAIPIPQGIQMLNRHLGEGTKMETFYPPMAKWITHVYNGVTEVHNEQPFIFYGTDWLAFGHMVIAIAFVGPLIDPVRNKWVVVFGMIASVLVIPWAFIFGPIRGIPFFWQIIDCCFGIAAFIGLWMAYRYINKMEKINSLN